MESCTVPLSRRPIFLPVIRAAAQIMSITPMPPVWIRSRMTACPNPDHACQVSLTTRPVTQTAEVAVNRASAGGHGAAWEEAAGVISSSVPVNMIIANPNNII